MKGGLFRGRTRTTRFRYRLFVTTFLGYGVNEGLRKYEQLLGDTLLAENKTSRRAYIRDSCLPTNLVKTVSRKDGSQFVRKVRLIFELRWEKDFVA